MSGEVQSIPASGRVKVTESVSVSDDFKIIAFVFKDGAGTLTCNLNELSEEMQARGLEHGITQKLRDSFAGVKGNAKDAFANASEVWDNLTKGLWSTKGEGGDGASALYVEALCRMKGWEIEVGRPKIMAMPEEWRKAAQKDPGVGAVISQIRLERAQEAVAKARDAAAKAGSAFDLGSLDVAA